MNLQLFIDKYFKFIWIGITVWLVGSLINALIGDGSEYYKLTTSVVTIGMTSFWIFVLYKFRKRGSQSIEDVRGKEE